MVNHLREFQEALEDFLDLTVYFNENEIRYKFQGFWTSSHFEKDIQEKTKKLEYLLLKQLKNGLDNKTLLYEIQLKMKDVHNFLYDVYYDDFDNLSKSNLKVRYSSALPENDSADLYTFEFFEKLQSDEKARQKFQSGNIEFTMLFDSLLQLFESFQRKDNSPSVLQFESLKLLDCIYSYRVILIDLLDTIEHYHSNFDKIDFSRIETDFITGEKNKCHSSLNKIRTAQLFKFLFDEGYLFMDDRAEKNETLFKRFLASKFTFNKNGSQSDIGAINQEFSELIWQHKDSQLEFIDEMIEKLEKRKKIIKDFNESKIKRSK